jgi:hypothetical protein
MCSAVTVSWVGTGGWSGGGPRLRRKVAGKRGGAGRGDKDTRRQEGDAKPAVGSAKGAGGRGVKTARRRTLAIGDRSGGAGGKGRHSLCKSKCSLSPRGGLLEGPEVRSTRGVCVARVQQNETKRARKKKQRGGGSLRGETRGWWGRGALRRLARLGALPDARRAPHGVDGVTARWGSRERREPREGSPGPRH